MQQIIKGPNSLLQLPGILRQLGAREVLFVTGEHVLQESIFSELLANVQLPYQIIHPAGGVLQIAAIPEFSFLDTIVAIGGGKVLDFAKGIIYQHQKKVRLIAVPTTAGSGSEATPIGVFYRGTEKVSLDAPQLLPQLAILDSALLADLPPFQRAVSAADALAQCIESIWNVHSTEASEAFSLTGLQLLWQNLPDFVSGKEVSATDHVMWGAHLAGKAIAITRTTGPHALSYFLTANYDVPHGQAVALTLPLFFLYNESYSSVTQLEKIFTVLGVKNAQEAFMACRNLFKQLGLATSLKDLNLHAISLDDWLASVNQQRFANNPVSFEASRLKELFQQNLF